MAIKEFAKNAVVPVTSAIVGGLIVVVGFKLAPSPSSQVSADINRGLNPERIFDDIFKNQQSISAFDSLSNRFGGGTINDIGRREDDNFVYYDVKIDDVTATSINAKVEGGYVTISGTTESKTGSDAQNDEFTSQSIFKSSFNRTFPLPENVDQKKLQMLTEKDKVILKFPKIKV